MEPHQTDLKARISELEKTIADAAETIERQEAETEHFARLAFVDLGANPPVAWKDRALTAEADVQRLTREAADAKFVLNDPAAFHLHALRNNTLSRMNALHLAGATDYDTLKQSALAAEAQRDGAYEALEPFAELVPAAFDDGLHGYCEVVLSINGSAAATLRVKQFRAAASAIRGAKGKDDQ